MKPNFVYKAYKGEGNPKAVGEVSMNITVKDMYSMVSLISMIAPSPDWFVGVDSYDLCGSDGKWKQKPSPMDLLPWDAGTEDGRNFTLTNDATMPQDFITIITKDSETVIKDDASKAFAQVTFMKYDEPTTTTTTTATPTPDSAQCPSSGVSTLLAIAFLSTLRLLF